MISRVKASKQKPNSPTVRRAARHAKTSPKTKREAKVTVRGAAEPIIVESTLKPIEAIIKLANSDLPDKSTPEIISCSNAVLEAITKNGQLDLTSREWGYIRNTAKGRLRIETGLGDNPFSFDLVRDSQLSAADLVYSYVYPFFLTRHATHNGSDKDSGTKASQRAKNEILAVFQPIYPSDVSFLILEALQNNDLRKIKRCTGCKRIYLAKNINRTQKFCSAICKRHSKWPAEKWAKYIRERRKKLTQGVMEEANRNREQEIQRWMKMLNLNKEQVLSLMKDDKKT